MSRKWRLRCRVLLAVICTVGLGTTVFGQEPAAGTPSPSTTPPAAGGRSDDDQPPASDDAPAKSETPATESQPATPPEAGQTEPKKEATEPKTETEPKKDATEPKKAETEPKKDATEPKKAETDPKKPATEPKKAATEPAKPESDPAKAAADPAKPATDPAQPAAPTADPAAAQAAFAAKMEEWKGILKSLRALTPRYSLATAEESVKIRQEWDDTIAQGELLIPQLRETGKAAYAASRGGDRMVERFLVKLLTDDITHDRFEMAHDLGMSLVTNGCQVKEVFDATGLAAFATNDFENAESLLNRAKDAGALSDKGSQNLDIVDEYKSHWAEEKAAREKEAAADDLPRVKITTTVGELVVELLENEAPETVGNFVYLVEEKKFYDGLSFHRVLPGFMAQGGCPNGNGSGGPGYMIKCETDAENHRKHFRGTLSMAHAGKDTGGSQFFLTFVPTSHLNGVHTVFGRVVEGMDVLERIERIDPAKPGVPTEPDKIIKMEVIRKRNHEYKPNKSQ